MWKSDQLWASHNGGKNASSGWKNKSYDFKNNKYTDDASCEPAYCDSDMQRAGTFMDNRKYVI